MDTQSFNLKYEKSWTPMQFQKLIGAPDWTPTAKHNNATGKNFLEVGPNQVIRASNNLSMDKPVVVSKVTDTNSGEQFYLCHNTSNQSSQTISVLGHFGGFGVAKSTLQSNEEDVE